MINNNDITITNVFDNYPLHNELKTLWGFSCYIELPQLTLLFDTGSNGRVLLDNLRKLNKDVQKIDNIFISHHHWDHIGGLDSIIELNPDIDIIVPSSISKLMVKDLKSMVNNVIVVDENGYAIFDSVYTSGIMGDENEVQEHSLIIDTNEGLIVITGCAHSGIVEIVQKSQKLLNKNIKLVVGGFHLMHEDDSQIYQVIDELKKINIDFLCPTHCTGDRAKEIFQIEFESSYIETGLGHVLKMKKIKSSLTKYPVT